MKRWPMLDIPLIFTVTLLLSLGLAVAVEKIDTRRRIS
ncbi:O-acetyltransferase WecH [Sodalis praecaptivus]|nr:O-acetyltransferase WecH [Sodalis praecaptivus]